MGIVTYEMEVSSSIPPTKMFKAFVLDGDNLIPKVLPQGISSVETIEGDGGVGTIKKICFGQASQFKYMKQKIDGLDKDNLTFSSSVIEGDHPLMNKLEKISNEIKFLASPDGGCIIKSVSKCYTIGDVDINEEDIKARKEKILGTFKAIETYLLANPDA